MMDKMKKMLVAYDGSEASRKAIDVALSCCTKEDEIILLTVIPPELVDSSFTKMLLPGIDLSKVIKPGTFKERAMESLKELAKKIEEKVKKVETVVEAGDAADEILLAAKNHQCDIIVLGYKGYGKEGRFLIGSVTDKVVRHAHTTVMVVR
jgi:nucleotide-binding universal stress UspA family protein